MKPLFFHHSASRFARVRFARRSGQALVGVLAAALILITLCLFFLGSRRGDDGEVRPSIARRSINKAEEVGGVSYVGQIQTLVEPFKENNGRYPASLDELKASAKDYPAEMWVDPVSKKPLDYDPQTGIVSLPKASAPNSNAAPDAARPANPNLPNIPAIPAPPAADSEQ